MSRRNLTVSPIILLAMLTVELPAQLQVTELTPRPNGLHVPVDVPIRIDFDRAVNPATVSADNIGAFGRWSGPVGGTFELTNGNQTVLFQPDAPFSPGELVTVNLSQGLLAVDGSSFTTGGFSQQFWTRSQRVANFNFNELAAMTTGSPSRPYGGIATDLDNDGWLDITMVNEDSADLRVFMNQADGTATFAPYTSPTFGVGNRASPSEAADFNGDGNADVAVANINDATISIVLGNGDGTFAPQQTIAVGTAPRGIAVLDFDGDGDMDVANTNAVGNDLSLHENLGNGIFSNTPTTLDAGIVGEWSLMAGDMNNDGLSDLVVASGSVQRIRVLTANEGGTFVPQPIQNTGGRSWMIALGDVNGDGNIDVSSANAQANSGAILLGNGDGTLQSATSYNVSLMGDGGNGFPLATDLGDLDGDGDLDWITSSFNGDWVVLENDGTGSFQFLGELPAPNAASCSLMADLDNDGDLDLALVDELDNLVIISRNEGTHVAPGDFDADGDLDEVDIDDLVQAIVEMDKTLIYDLNGDGVVEHADLIAWLALGGAANLPDGSSYMLGDANLDGTVDGRDFLAWSNHKFTAAAAWTSADFNASGYVDGADFLLWNRNKFPASDASPVPEPTTILLPVMVAWLVRSWPTMRRHRPTIRRPAAG